MHKLEKTTLYLINGVTMTVVFFFIRICFYFYVICIKCVQLIVFDWDAFWARYDDHMKPFCYFSLLLYFGMYAVNLYWFKKMVMGCLKALGLIEGSKKRVDSDKGK